MDEEILFDIARSLLVLTLSPLNSISRYVELYLTNPSKQQLFLIASVSNCCSSIVEEILLVYI